MGSNALTILKKIFLFIFCFSISIAFSQKWELKNRAVEPNSKKLVKTVSIELHSGDIIKGELISVDEENGVVTIKNSSESTEIKFTKIYKIHDSEKQRLQGGIEP